MFTEYEVATVLKFPKVVQELDRLRTEFLQKETPYIRISDHDFFSFIMMVPSIGVTLADGKITIFEEFSLNKKARKISKGTYFMKEVPAIHVMKYLIKKYDFWELKFLKILKLAIEKTCDVEKLDQIPVDASCPVDYNEYKLEIFRTPYILIRFISSFFLENDEDIINQKRRIGKKELSQIIRLGETIGLHRFTVFNMFCQTYNSKSID